MIGLLAVTACAQTFDATSVGIDATLASPAGTPLQGERFSINRKAVYLVAGLIQASKPALDDVLNAQVTGNARVADLRIKVRSRFSDVLISILTVGMVVPRTVTFEGVVIRQ